MSGAGRRDQRLSGRRGGAVSGRPPPGAPAGAPLRHRGRPLLAVSAAYPGPPRADLRRVGGGCRGVVALVVELHTHGDPRPAGDAGLANLLHRAARDATRAYEALRVTAMKPVGASAPAATGCGRPSPRRRPSTLSARSKTRKQSWEPTSTACSCATGGWSYINGEHQTCRCSTCFDAVSICWRIIPTAVGRSGAGHLAPASRCATGATPAVSAHGLATARGHCCPAQPADNPPPHDDAERFAAHLASEFGSRSCSDDWRAEQAIRPAVVIRKVCGGNRTRDTQQVLASVVRSTPARGHDVARPRLDRPRRIRPSAADRVSGSATTTEPTHDRRLTAAPGEMPRR